MLIERGAGAAAHFGPLFRRRFADAAAILASAGVLKVQPPSLAEVARSRGAVIVGYMQAYARPDRPGAQGAESRFAWNWCRAFGRSPWTLSSQASVAGYKGGTDRRQYSRRFLPMLTTAAGTIRPASVLVIGAGVAGLQAIATAKRLGAVVEAYDVRSATKDQVKSLGAKFIETGVSAEGAGGYARELTAEEKTRQQEVLDARIAASDAVISTASVPGRAAPRIITQGAVERMKPGS